MRIIKERKESEKTAECDNCYAIIGYYPSEVKLFFSAMSLGHYFVRPGRYLYNYITCPCCGHYIIIRDNNGED